MKNAYKSFIAETCDYAIVHDRGTLQVWLNGLENLFWIILEGLRILQHFILEGYKIRSDQSLSRVRLFATPWIAARQASLSITNSQSSLRLTSIESVKSNFEQWNMWQQKQENEIMWP